MNLKQACDQYIQNNKDIIPELITDLTDFLNGDRGETIFVINFYSYLKLAYAEDTLDIPYNLKCKDESYYYKKLLRRCIIHKLIY